jgi:hypothetical protein
MRFRCSALFGLILLIPSLFAQQVAEEAFDVVVVSGSSGGFGAAMAAGRMGMRVALVEDTPVLGGMLSNGISNIDTYSYESLSGIFEEFRGRVRAYYQPVSATDPIFQSPRPPRHDHKGRQSNAASEGGRWEPHVAAQIFREMAAGVPGIQIYYDTWATGALMQGNRITGVSTEDKSGRKRRLLARVVIDATHEADVAAWAGVPYRVGREARSRREPHAGEIYYFNGTGEIMEGGSGRQDHAIVSYGLRLCIQRYAPEDGDAHVLREPPPGYQAENYRLAGFGDDISMPGRKTEMNANPVGNELQWVNWVWPEATRAERRKLYERYRNHALGFLYYVQHERGWKHLGLPRDEFMDNGNVPYRVFVREARRIEGEAMMDEADVNPLVLGRGLLPELRPDSIAIGHYAIDSKPVLPKTDGSTPEKGAGDFFLANVAMPFQVPYGAIVPKRVEGLLVPVALSATHVAFSAVRMDPTWMVLGQAAGTAAALAIRSGVPVRALPVDSLQAELIRQKVRLLFYWDVPLEHPAFAAIQQLSVSGVVRGHPDRTFRPDDALTRAEAAALIAKAQGLWPSVSDLHFRDVPWTHWAFRDIETLFDNRLLGAFGVEPRWPLAGSYLKRGSDGFARAGQEAFGNFDPGLPVTWAQFVELCRDSTERQRASIGGGIVRPKPRVVRTDNPAWVKRISASENTSSPSLAMPDDANAPITRAKAAMLVAAMRKQDASIPR